MKPFILAALAWLAPTVALAASATLTDTAGSGGALVFPLSSGTFDETGAAAGSHKRIGVHPNLTTIDFSNETGTTTHVTDGGTGECSYSGTNNPLRDGDTGEAIITGGRIVGDIDLTAYSEVWALQAGGYCDGVAVLMDPVSRTALQIKNIRINEVWDGLRFANRPCRLGSDNGCYVLIDGVWVSRVRDDAIELDNHQGVILVVDSLFDRIFGFLSVRIGDGAPDHSAMTQYVVRSRIRMFGWPYSASKPKYHLDVCKIESVSPQIAFIDNVIAFDSYTAEEVTTWTTCRDKISSKSRGNLVIWTSSDPYPSGAFPGWPATGFTIINENTPGYSAAADRLALWHSYCNAWVAAHPSVETIAGAGCED